MPSIPALRVKFDDGEEFEIVPKARDMALAERDFHHDFTESGTFRSVYATALAVLGRMKRAGEIDITLPDSIDGLMDIADVEGVEEEDAEGKDSVPVRSTG